MDPPASFVPTWSYPVDSNHQTQTTFDPVFYEKNSGEYMGTACPPVTLSDGTYLPDFSDDLDRMEFPISKASPCATKQVGCPPHTDVGNYGFTNPNTKEINLDPKVDDSKFNEVYFPGLFDSQSIENLFFSAEASPNSLSQVIQGSQNGWQQHNSPTNSCVELPPQKSISSGQLAKPKRTRGQKYPLNLPLPRPPPAKPLLPAFSPAASKSTNKRARYVSVMSPSSSRRPGKLPVKSINPATTIPKGYQPERHYAQLPKVPDSWDFFHYNINGELRPGSLLTTPQMKTFIYHNPAHDIAKGNKMKGGLILWIQQTPSNSTERYGDPSTAKCRFRKCLRNHQIACGSTRVAIDEQTKHRHNHNPQHNAAYVHLYCLEGLLDFPEICRKFDVRPEYRILPSEPFGENKMLLAFEEELKCVEEFINICHNESKAAASRFKTDRRPYQGTLLQRLIEAKRVGKESTIIQKWEAEGKVRSIPSSKAKDKSSSITAISSYQQSKRYNLRRRINTSDVEVIYEDDEEEHKEESEEEHKEESEEEGEEDDDDDDDDDDDENEEVKEEVEDEGAEQEVEDAVEMPKRPSVRRHPRADIKNPEAKTEYPQIWIPAEHKPPSQPSSAGYYSSYLQPHPMPQSLPMLQEYPPPPTYPLTHSNLTPQSNLAPFYQSPLIPSTDPSINWIPIEQTNAVRLDQLNTNHPPLAQQQWQQTPSLPGEFPANPNEMIQPITMGYHQQPSENPPSRKRSWSSELSELSKLSELSELSEEQTVYPISVTSNQRSTAQENSRTLRSNPRKRSRMLEPSKQPAGNEVPWTQPQAREHIQQVQDHSQRTLRSRTRSQQSGQADHSQNTPRRRTRSQQSGQAVHHVELPAKRSRRL